MQNKRGEWVPAIEEPYFHMFKKECRCGEMFWTDDGYRGHYAYKHILMGFDFAALQSIKI